MDAVEFRGKQSSISRLILFDKTAFIHMLFYRILVILGLFTGVVTLIALSYNNTELIRVSEYLIAAIWFLFTPEIYAVIKVGAIWITKGAASGEMNESFLSSAGIKKHLIAFKTIEYFAVVLWLFGLLIYIKLLGL